MKNAILVVSAMLLSTAFGAVSHETRHENDSGVIFDLHLIGTTDGVTYFYEPTFRNWAAAKTYCQSAGMHLASITTKPQLDMLTSTGVLPNGNYWTAGRDADEIREFTWDDTKQPVPDLLAVNYDTSVTTYLSCISVSKAVNSLRFKSSACASASFYTICSN